MLTNVVDIHFRWKALLLQADNPFKMSDFALALCAVAGPRHSLQLMTYIAYQITAFFALQTAVIRNVHPCFPKAGSDHSAGCVLEWIKSEGPREQSLGQGCVGKQQFAPSAHLYIWVNPLGALPVGRFSPAPRSLVFRSCYITLFLSASLLVHRS